MSNRYDYGIGVQNLGLKPKKGNNETKGGRTVNEIYVEEGNELRNPHTFIISCY